MRSFFCILAAAFSSFACVRGYQSLPHKKWTCDNCPDDENEKLAIFGAVHLALHHDQRDVYLSFQRDWLDKLLDPFATVKIEFVPTHGIADFNPKKVEISLTENEETFRVIFSTIPIERENLKVHGSIDKFLVRNPCWIPLHEPHFDFSLNMTAEDLDSYKALIDSESHNNKHFGRSVIFVRLPSFSFHATCLLYEAITSHQFPHTCPETVSDYRVHYMSGHGYGGSYVTMMEQMVMNLASSPNRILVITNAGSKKGLGQGWYWNDLDTCPLDVNLHDPWGCNFIPISSCNSALLVREAKEDPYIYYDPSAFQGDKHLFLRNLTKINDADRLKYKDGYAQNREQWFRYRVHAFLQRPNARMRFMIKRALKNVYLLGVPRRAEGKKKANSNIRRRNLLEGGSQAGDSANAQEEPNYWLRRVPPNHPITPCMALHVRNGDVWTDNRGPVGQYQDRSLNGHLYVAKRIMREMGLVNIYLATDNITAVELAATLYPEYSWFMLQRKIPVYNRRTYQHIHEDSPQIELANSFADFISAARCSAIVSAFDSSFTRDIQYTQCNHNQAMECPPYDSVLNYLGADLPFAGSTQST